MKEITTKYELEVPFYDLDPMNIVWHGNYVKYLEEARCDFFRKICYKYDEIYNDGVSYPIVKLEMKFKKSALFGEKLVVTSTLIEIEPALIFKYKIENSETGETKCTAKTMQMGVRRETGETVLNLSGKFKKKLEKFGG